MPGTLSGALSASGVLLTGKLSAASSHSYPPYTGDYEVTPKTEPQTLDVAGKVLAKDLVVKAIPYFERKRLDRLYCRGDVALCLEQNMSIKSSMADGP